MSVGENREHHNETTLGEAALAYAHGGWPVFPLHGVWDRQCTCNKSDCSQSGKHPRTPHGFKDATTDPATIERWWAEWPDANIGVATGTLSALVVLDLDKPEAAEVLRQRGVNRETWRSATGRGEHWWFRHPGFPIPNRSGLFPGVDVRGDGGYVVVPPSRHRSGTVYRWLAKNGTGPAALPAGLLDVLQNGSARKRSLVTVANPIREGMRNDTLASLAGSMRRRGMSQEAIEAALLAENARRCDPPLPEDEARKIATSVSRYQPAEDLPTSIQPETSVVPWRCSLDILAAPVCETVWLIGRIVPAESVVLLSGREGSMKTWIGLDWAQAVAEGLIWLEHACEAGAVLYLDAEMPNQVFLVRLQAFGGSRNLNVWRWQDANFPARLDDPHLIEAAKVHRLIIVDSLRRFMHRLEENSSTDMAIITDALRQLTRWGATVLAIHHAPKDPLKSGYRGSTELGAGVDIALTLEKRKPSVAEILELTASKTRYPEDLKLTLRVERREERPVFHRDSGEACTVKQAAIETDLAQLGTVIADLQSCLERRPNQSEVIGKARNRGLASRNTLLGWLCQGEGTRWQSEPDGRSRVYSLLSTCPPVQPLGGQDGLDN